MFGNSLEWSICTRRTPYLIGINIETKHGQLVDHRSMIIEIKVGFNQQRAQRWVSQ
jgi:hypothetical protein